MSNTEPDRDLILRFWKSWQGQSDWDAMRACLAETIVFGGQSMSADQFTQMCKQGSPWQDVELLDSVFTAGAGSLLYEGTDTKSGKRVRVTEFIRVDTGKITSMQACFGSGMPPV